MSDQLPASGIIKVRVLQVNTLTEGEVVHDVKARILPRTPSSRPVMLRIRGEMCQPPPRVGDRMRLTLQFGQPVGVEWLRPRKSDGDADAAEDRTV